MIDFKNALKITLSFSITKERLTIYRHLLIKELFITILKSPYSLLHNVLNTIHYKCKNIVKIIVL